MAQNNPLPGVESMLEDGTRFTIEHSQVWREFNHQLKFYASTDKNEFANAFVVPDNIPFVVYQLRKPLGDFDLDGAALKLFKDIVADSKPEKQQIYALDWQHESFKVQLDKATQLPLHAYPDGDYYIFVSKDMKYGWCGHPWEWSITLFGARLLETLAKDKHEALRKFFSGCKKLRSRE